MKYGILGDIHSNLSALRAVLERLQAEGVDRLVSVGEVVGYGAAPCECIALLREVGATVVLGNHDAACVELLDTLYFNPYAQSAVLWTRGVLDRGDREWLGALPMVKHFEHGSVAHGTLFQPEEYDYIQSPRDADPSLDVMPLPVCFVGHTHVPVTLLRLEDDPSHTCLLYTSDAADE